MKARKTLLKYIRELGNLGFLNSEEFKKIEERKPYEVIYREISKIFKELEGGKSEK